MTVGNGENMIVIFGYFVAGGRSQELFAT